jgi:alkylated DNA nucleotide flippase Atl1
LLPATAAVAAIDGAIFTTTANGTTVNGNIYALKSDVYLNGGPQNQNSNGLPDGEYYFQVTDPSGAVLLSTDPIGCRQVRVTGGRVAGASPLSSCPHADGVFNPANRSTPVQLIPYNDTPNSGGEYKVWLTPVSAYNVPGACPANQGAFGFCNKDSKTDNFKVQTPQAAHVTVCKFNDTNANGVRDANEPLIPHWPVTATGVDGGTVSTQMNDDGCVSFTYSGFTSLHMSQTVTLTEGTFGPDWQQTAPPDGTNGAITVANGVISVVLTPGVSITAPNFGNTNPNCPTGCPLNNLVVTKTAFPRYDKTFHWTIAKDVDRTHVQQSGTDATFNYTVTLTRDAGTIDDVEVVGTIRVSNPGPIDIPAVVSDVVDDGGSCTISEGPSTTIPAGSHVDLHYVCTYPDGAIPAPGTNTATAAWAFDTPHGSAPVDFGTAIVTLKDDQVNVSDTRNPLLGTAKSSDPNPETFTYSATLTGVPGTCRTFDNTASFTTNTTGTSGSSHRAVDVCVGRDLTVSKTANATFDSGIAKTVDKTRVEQAAGSSATFTYGVTVTNSGWRVSGNITVTNPNDWEDITTNVSDVVTNGGVCTVVGGTGVLVPRSSAVVLPYTCTYAAAPSTADGTNVATATWDPSAAATPSGSASGTAAFAFGSVTVTDSFAGGPATTLGVVAGNVASKTFTETRTVDNAPAGTCTSYDNVATIAGTSQSATRTVTVCVGLDLHVSKTASAAFDSAIVKNVDKTRVQTADGSAAFNYSVTVTESGWRVSGQITVTNPNDWEDITADVTDAVNNGAACTVAGGTSVSVPRNGTAVRSYSCTYAAAPALPSGLNTATASWNATVFSTPSGSGTGNATFAFNPLTVTDSFAGGPPTTLGTIAGNVASQTFTDTHAVSNAPAGTCSAYDNLATIVETNQSATRTVTVCVGLDLRVSKTATAAYNSAITKNADKTQVKQAGTSATLTYTVTVTESGWNVYGNITVANPNDWEDITADVTDMVDNSGACTVTGGTAVVVPRSSSVALAYSCNYASAPAAPAGVNTGKATWNAATFSTPSGTGTGTATFAFAPLTVTDSFAGGPPTTLGTVAGNVASQTFPDTRTVNNLPAGTCSSFDNMAKIVETGQSATRTVSVCVGLDLRVSKTATASFNSAIVKNVDKTRVEQAGNSATFNYTLVVTESGWTVSGNIMVTNPNDWEDITANLTDLVNNGGVCTVSGGTNVVVPRGGSASRSYSCSYAAAPSATAGVNTGTATWDATAFFTPSSTGSGTASFAFNPLTVTDSFAGGPPTVLGTVAGNVASQTFTDTRTVNNLPGGTCSSFNNTATLVETNQTATRTVTACVGLNLVVSKTAAGAFDSAIAKNVDKTVVEQAGGSATFTYTVTLTESGWRVLGNITVTNPNDWEDIAANLSDAVDNGGTCSVTGGTSVLVPRSNSIVRAYSCSYAAAPTLTTGLNTATATWNAATFSTPGGSGTGTAPFAFASLTVTDSFAGGPPTTLGVVAGNVASKAFTETRTVNSPSTPTCATYDNLARIVETNQSATRTIKICNTNTGSKTIGYWRNKNGQGIITGCGSTSGVCNVGTWLRTYAPFQDLSPTATCTQVAAYAAAIIDAANAGGTSMNPMLKAQMMATALNAFFSDPALGGNSLGAPAPIANVTIDVTTWSGGFGGATSLTVGQMLAYAASQSNAGGTIWYGQDKTVQGFAKDAFDAINNDAAPVL